MANEQSGVKFFVILTILCLAAQRCISQEEDEAGPLLDVMQSLLKDSSKGKGSGMETLAPLLQGFLQSGGFKQLGDMVNTGTKKSNTLNLLSGLASLMQTQKTNSEESSSGFDPSMLGTIIDIFSSISTQGGDAEKSKKSSGRQKENEAQNSVDWEPIIGVVGNVMSSIMAGGGKDENSGGGLEALLSFLPVLTSSLGGKHHPHASGNVQHHDHAPFLPPFLENIHEYWDHFTSSQFGRALWENSGLSTLAAQYQDKNGNFEPERMFDSLEDKVFRRRWIRGIASFIAEWTNHMTDPEAQQRYLNTAQVVTNSFLQSEGYPKNTHLDFKKPGDSISALIDEAFKRQLGMAIQSGAYIKPAVLYLQEILSLSQRKGMLSGITTQSVESRLTNTLESQLIEPILRTNRAYRFALRNKACAQYVLCVVHGGNSANQRGIKPAVTKAANLVASWFLSTHLDVSFFDLMTTTDTINCRDYDKNCSEFHNEDYKATTEYLHNEL